MRDKINAQIQEYTRYEKTSDNTKTTDVRVPISAKEAKEFDCDSVT